MTVNELITQLQSLHPSYSGIEVKILYDGAVRANLDNLYVSNVGDLVVSDNTEHAIWKDDEPMETI